MNSCQKQKYKDWNPDQMWLNCEAYWNAHTQIQPTTSLGILNIKIKNGHLKNLQPKLGKLFQQLLAYRPRKVVEVMTVTLKYYKNEYIFEHRVLSKCFFAKWI